MLDAMLMLSLIVALTCFFFWVLFAKGLLPALLVLFLPLLPIIIIVVVVIGKAIYGLHGILGVITLIIFVSIAATPFVFAIGILMDVDHGIDIFKRKPRKKPEPHKITHLYATKLGINTNINFIQLTLQIAVKGAARGKFAICSFLWYKLEGNSRLTTASIG